ncbi:MAG: 6,7-dimethyl-8-ribityllumazine synthase [Gammaproteobacteria bacterium]|nr:6,7-dimethyl-8-ribityllumazine synthase [Gammaproteobacteria bacterium]
MTAVRTIEGDRSARNLRVAILASRFNSLIVDSLLAAAIDTLHRHHADTNNITVVRVPGAFELPVTAKHLAESGDYDVIIALGAVVRGGTPHFEYVAGECSRGLSDVALQTGVPVTFGVLTVDNIEQALERSGDKAGNKGIEAAESAIEMANLVKSLPD